MNEWFQRNPIRYLRDLETLIQMQPGLSVRVVKAGFPLNMRRFTSGTSVVAYGMYTVSLPDMNRLYGYRIGILFPANYPSRSPELYVCDHRLPLHELDRHIFGKGQACLGSPGDIISRWSQNPDLANFLSEVVNPWIVWQICYDAGVENLPERSHGPQGILELYREILGPLEYPVIHKFMKLLSSGRIPSGQKPCPCGSGILFHKCHEASLRGLQKHITQEGLCKDLYFLESVA